MAKLTTKTPIRAEAKPKVKPKSKITKNTIYYIVFLIAWAGLSTIAGQLIVGFIMSLLLGKQINQPIWTATYQFLAYALALLSIIFIPPKLAHTLHREHKLSAHVVDELKTNPAELGLNDLPTFVDIGLAPIAYILYSILANFVLNLMEVFPWFNGDQTQDLGFNYFSSGLNKLIAVIALVFIAPIAEELIMRGWLYGKLRKKTPAIVAILLVSLLFAVLHDQWNVAISTFILSIILCGLREITGTIYSSILLHILVNGISFYVLSSGVIGF